MLILFFLIDALKMLFLFKNYVLERWHILDIYDYSLNGFSGT